MLETVALAIVDVLMTPDANEKATGARMVYDKWRNKQLSFTFNAVIPERPARPKQPELLPPNAMPKRRKGGTLLNRVALLHAIAHIELNAIDLALDITVRFGGDMPIEFTDGWLKVADDEARHFVMIQNRLTELDSYYGALPAHDGLWQSAQATAQNLAARLAIVPMVLEARGLDVTPDMMNRLKNAGDTVSASILEIIYTEEIDHVALGKKWFSYLAQKTGQDEEIWFHRLVQDYFAGKLKRPFNTCARSRAGMPESFYDPLADLIRS